ncbi:MAG: urease accessory protein UreD [Burkholderiaceae bacterium]|jgi:urease accessory protein|nr:urease accessory protein UreD [Burkholderiaceae bacterium]
MPAAPGWLAQLRLDYRHDGNRTNVDYEHKGPLRVLKNLYPEGDSICHNVLVHPPSGLVGGDTIDIQVGVGQDAHALVTTPGATRFYRSEAGLATQRVRAHVSPGAKLEWLPLEAIAYSGCDALNEASFTLEPGAEMMAWDITALGLPNAHLPFEQGQFQQHFEIANVWLDRGCIKASDQHLLRSPLGLAGQQCMATLVFASGSPIARERVAQTLELTQDLLQAHDLAPMAGVTAPNPQTIVLRVLSPHVEGSFDLLRTVWGQWRAACWGLPSTPPRIWSM